MKRCASLLMALACGTVVAGRVSVSCPTDSIEAYRALAAYAKSIGATHLDACQVEPSMWQWNRDRNDPYPNWSMIRPSLTKYIVPEALGKYLPADYAARNLETLKARAAILKEFGFKSEFSGFEPAYLPEEVYLDHPEWRGARCDQCRRARSEYYAPCTDNREIRSMYVDMVAELCRICPFEAFRFRVNDSGSGLCWSQHQYPGANGPLACKGGDYAQRVVDFMSLFQDGAAKAGLKEVKVNCRMSLGESEPAVLAKLKPGQSVNNKTAAGSASELVIGFPNRFLDHTAPVLALSRVVHVLRQVQEAQRHPGADVSIGLRSFDEEDTKRILSLYLNRKIGEGPAALGAAVEALAATFVGEARKVELAEAWYQLESGINQLDTLNKGGHVFLLGSVHQRWLVRPFVAFPEELKPEEKTYYRAFQFQAMDEKAADDMLDLQGTRWLDGFGGKSIATGLVNKGAMPPVQKALKMFRALVSAAKDEVSRAYLETLCDRTEFYLYLMRNFANVVEFQYTMDTIDRNNLPKDFTLEHSLQGDPRLYRLETLARAEIDNCRRMIAVLKKAKRPVVQMTLRAEDESIMTYGQNLIENLEKKTRIMECHRRDFRRLLPCYNR